MKAAPLFCAVFDAGFGATAAGFARAAVHGEAMLEIAKLPIRLDIIAQRRSARPDRGSEHLADRGHQFRNLFLIA